MSLLSIPVFLADVLAYEYIIMPPAIRMHAITPSAVYSFISGTKGRVPIHTARIAVVNPS